MIPNHYLSMQSFIPTNSLESIMFKEKKFQRHEAEQFAVSVASGEKPFGIVYLASHPLFPALLKLGVTTSEVSSHLTSLCHESLPASFQVVNFIKSLDPFELFRQIEERLAEYSKPQGRYHTWLSNPDAVVTAFDLFKANDLVTPEAMHNLSGTPTSGNLISTIDQKIDTLFDLVLTLKKDKMLISNA